MKASRRGFVSSVLPTTLYSLLNSKNILAFSKPRPLRIDGLSELSSADNDSPLWKLSRMINKSGLSAINYTVSHGENF